jgi:hypothetical protein
MMVRSDYRRSFDKLMATCGFVRADTENRGSSLGQQIRAAAHAAVNRQQWQSTGAMLPFFEMLFDGIVEKIPALAGQYESQALHPYRVETFKHGAFPDRLIHVVAVDAACALSYVVCRRPDSYEPDDFVTLRDFMNSVPKGGGILPGEMFAIPYNCVRYTTSDIGRLLFKRDMPQPG